MYVLVSLSLVPYEGWVVKASNLETLAVLKSPEVKWDGATQGIFWQIYIWFFSIESFHKKPQMKLQILITCLDANLQYV